MKQAVNQNEVEAFVEWNRKVLNITEDKSPVVTSLSIPYISFVPIYSDVVCMVELVCISTGTTPYVQNTTYSAQIIVFDNRREFLLNLWSHPKAVNQRPSHDGVNTL